MTVRSIDAVHVLNDISWHRKPTPVSEFESGFNQGLNQAMWIITHAPTLTPPVIGYCKDCYNWNEQFSAGRKSLNNYVCYCSEWSDPEIGYERYTRPDDYCSYFEPKEELKDAND